MQLRFIALRKQAMNDAAVSLPVDVFNAISVQHQAALADDVVGIDAIIQRRNVMSFTWHLLIGSGILS